MHPRVEERGSTKLQLPVKPGQIKNMQAKSKTTPNLVIRNAVPADIDGIRAVMAKAYLSLGSYGVYSEAQLLGQLHQFPQG